MFAPGTEDGYSTPIQGIRQKTLAHGDKTLMTEFLEDSVAIEVFASPRPDYLPAS